MNIVQFAGKIYHKDCFDTFLTEEKAKNRVISDYVPALTEVDVKNLESDDACEGCGGIFVKEQDDVEAAPKAEDEDNVVKKDDVVDTPSPLPRRRR